MSNEFLYVVLCGVIASFIMDISAYIQKKLWEIPSLNYCLVGRWILTMPYGKFSHHNILQSEQRSFECRVGWLSHYIIGVLFASVYLYISSVFSIETSVLSVVSFGMLTVLVPYFIMQPSFGFGIAASKTPNPKQTRFRSLVAHTSFGVGLYVSFQFFEFVNF